MRNTHHIRKVTRLCIAAMVKDITDNDIVHLGRVRQELHREVDSVIQDALEDRKDMLPNDMKRLTLIHAWFEPNMWLTLMCAIQREIALAGIKAADHGLNQRLRAEWEETLINARACEIELRESVSSTNAGEVYGYKKGV